MCPEQGYQLYNRRLISITVLSTVAVASESWNVPQNTHHREIFNMSYMWLPEGSRVKPSPVNRKP